MAEDDGTGVPFLTLTELSNACECSKTMKRSSAETNQGKGGGGGEGGILHVGAMHHRIKNQRQTECCHC